MIPYDKYTTKDFMINNISFVEANEPVTKVYQIMQRDRIRHIPVLDKGQAVGVISDRDVKFVSHSDGIVNMTAKDIMTEEPYSILEGSSIREAVFYMWEKKISSALIHNKKDKVVGIFTSTDALRILTESIEEPEEEF